MKFALVLAILIALVGCDFSVPGADEKFGKQNFVSAVSLIELHKVRYGEYPNSLQDLRFLGDWDAIWLAAVEYARDADGYDLYLQRGWIGKPKLVFPVEFKRGLGIKKTNVEWEPGPHE